MKYLVETAGVPRRRPRYQGKAVWVRSGFCRGSPGGVWQSLGTISCVLWLEEILHIPSTDWAFFVDLVDGIVNYVRRRVGRCFSQAGPLHRLETSCKFNSIATDEEVGVTRDDRSTSEEGVSQGRTEPRTRQQTKTKIYKFSFSS